MTFEEALEIAYTRSNGYACEEALDMGDFWAFAFVPKETACGGAYVTVNKSDGSLGAFVPTSNLPLFREATQITLKQQH